MNELLASVIVSGDKGSTKKKMHLIVVHLSFNPLISR